MTCRCGSLKGVLHGCDRTTGSRVQCYCRDCQAGAHALGAADLLTERGGSLIYQTSPARLEITEGGELLACLRLSPRGLMRWYAACCDTPMFNTMDSPRWRFMGVLLHAISPEDHRHLGPEISVANSAGALPGAPALRDRGVARAVFNLLRRHVTATLRGQRHSPFFTADGAPVVTPRVLTLAERRAATPAHLSA